MIRKSKKKCMSVCSHVHAFAKTFLLVISILNDVMVHAEVNVMKNSYLIVETTKQNEMDSWLREITNMNTKCEYCGKRKTYFRRYHDKSKQTRKMREKNIKNKNKKRDGRFQ